MAEFAHDCPRCKRSQVTFDLLESSALPPEQSGYPRWEMFSRCRRCFRCTIFVAEAQQWGFDLLTGEKLAEVKGSVEYVLSFKGFVSLKDFSAVQPPEDLPDDVAQAFKEGARCVAVQCYNAAGTMFRLAIDLATDPLLPAIGASGAPNATTRRNLGLRLPWMFDNKVLPEDLRELATCVKEDGNDGAHKGTLSKHDAEDLQDFAHALLDRIHSEPARLKAAQARRAARRNPGP